MKRPTSAALTFGLVGTKNEGRKRYSVQWKAADCELPAADVERLEDLIAPLIARLIMDERSAAAREDGSGNNKDEDEVKRSR